MKFVFIVILLLLSFFSVHSQQTKDNCPKIKLTVTEKPLMPGKPVDFSVKVGEHENLPDLRYSWIIRGGTILKGQGTTNLQFAANDEDNGSRLTVAVRVIGLPNNCTDTVSEFVDVVNLPIGQPVDEFGKLSLGDFRGRLDSFMFSIQNDPANPEGLIQLVFDKNESRRVKLAQIKNVLAILDFRKFDKSRITFAISEGDRQRTTLWIVPQGAKFPEYSSSSNERISDRNSQIYKAEELKQKINDVCLKNGPN